MRPADQDKAVFWDSPRGFLPYLLAWLSVGQAIGLIERLNRRPFDEVEHRGRW
jgi:hypothetical protein